ncbi:MAG TPA: sulfatase-like hydrolase/transferase, partial [Planctomycetaceae bacterium]|nr:sulfatase-like hydrolase/transferase [Planctomycetaceae bacterium]
MSRRPNVLIVMSDEQSWDTMGCTGNPAARTPNLDALCAESTSFDHAYTPFPLCCPSRTSLWTSRMPRHHGVLGNWRPIVPQLRSAGVAQAFRQAGYHTIYTGKWHVPGTTPAQMGWADASAIPAVLKGRDRGRYIPDYREYAASRGYQLDEKHIENLTAADIAATRDQPYATASVRLEDFLETWQTGEFLQALDRRPGDSPWLATCSYNAPHFPM